MPIISDDIDAGTNGTAYRTQAVNDTVLIKADVALSGLYGIQNGADPQGNQYYDDRVMNSGTIACDIGVDFASSVDSLFNSISGLIEGAIAVQIFGAGDYIYNAGTMTGSSCALEVTGSSDRISNTGSLVGSQQAIVASLSDSLNIRNTGSIVGDVQFGSGANLFNGRDGALNGTILGGNSADTVYLGNDGETVRGGDGVDRLYAGTGPDTFVLTHLSASDVDHIHHVNASQDTLELEHASFGQLTAEKSVVFATGNRSASAADHLFYNPTSGVLFYDADGSGTKSAARAVADLDPGLRLTAKNFEVV